MNDAKTRRRTIARIGWVCLLGLTLAACIFDKSDYQGGGHLDRGATAGTASSDAKKTPTGNTDNTDEADSGGGNALPPSSGTPSSTSTTPVKDAAAE
ncbi:hypothetical protein AKJ09_10312 [Labilithrix luteola]|uniref:Lipoprotein n=1 Tax=Labilithrix luteola TaxID=1391654 RepID=A0A0K1QD24_9BACT|nr:hypothetical protein [Labilithrix luteola]AKV03649.1 hypothetical protein AKJ09_10312 [Labilithrix luteola]